VAAKATRMAAPRGLMRCCMKSPVSVLRKLFQGS
jgi:hypothetical protein